MEMNEQIANAAALFNAGRYAEAAAEFNAVAERPETDNTAKAFMCHNIALCNERMGHIDAAITAQATGARWSLMAYMQIQQERARLLSRHGRDREAAELLRKTLGVPELRADDRAAIEASIRDYEQRDGRPQTKESPAKPSTEPPGAGPTYREVPRGTF